MLYYKCSYKKLTGWRMPVLDTTSGKSKTRLIEVSAYNVVYDEQETDEHFLQELEKAKVQLVVHRPHNEIQKYQGKYWVCSEYSTGLVIRSGKELRRYGGIETTDRDYAVNQAVKAMQKNGIETVLKAIKRGKKINE